MTFATEFPDFPVDTMPAIPAGFVDTSWHNDTCPSFLNEAAGLILFVDYADTSLREHAEGSRFSVNRWQDGNAETLFETDDWAAVEASIPNFVKANPTALAAMPVTNRAEAEAFIAALFSARLGYHFDDGAHQCLFENGLVSEADASYIEGQVSLCYDAWRASGADLRHDCPIGHALKVMGEAA